VLLAPLALALLIACAPAPTLPIYQLAQPAPSKVSPPPVVGPFTAPGMTVSLTADRVFFRAGSLRLEVYLKSGGFWLEDSTQLWNPELTPQLPDSSLLRPAALAMATRGPGLMRFNEDTTFTTFEFEEMRPTLVRTRTRTGVAGNAQLDWQVGFGARVTDGTRKFPVTGGGGRFKLHYGDHGKVIGFNGVWRDIRQVARRDRLVPISVADQQYLQRIGGTDPVVYDPPQIAYYSAPAPFAQDTLYPVYVYAGRKVIGGDSIPLRVVLIPATERGGAAPVPGTPVSLPTRTAADQPRPGSMDPEGPEEGHDGPPATPGNPWREVGASWLGKMGGVPHAEEDATGLLEALRADGWAVNFNWGDADAWYQDWNTDRGRWADTTDLLFYVGHASQGGWKLYDSVKGTQDVPQYRRLSASDAALAPGMYGAQDLEWIIIAACGPLQDESLSQGGGSAIDRWSALFGGLHMLLGYASVTFDTPDEGRLFAQYALEGNTVIDAWFRAAAETQPSTNGRRPPDGPDVWAGAMWAKRSGVPSPYLDHLWGHGDVAPDPVPPDSWSVLWSPT
jgi:hypothetical protein